MFDRVLNKAIKADINIIHHSKYANEATDPKNFCDFFQSKNMCYHST